MAEFDALPASLDVVVLALPLTPEPFMSAGRLAQMRDGALLVNVGRGGLVDTQALLSQVPRISAALDVTDPEPLPRGPSALGCARGADHPSPRRRQRSVRAARPRDGSRVPTATVMHAPNRHLGCSVRERSPPWEAQPAVAGSRHRSGDLVASPHLS